MDSYYYGSPDQAVPEEWEPVWEEWPGVYENFGDYLAWEKAKTTAQAAASLVLDSFRWVREYSARSNPLHEYYVGGVGARPSDQYDDAELAEGANPIPVPVLAAMEKGAGAITWEKTKCFRNTNFQRHWAAMVRAEFIGYWGSRAEQLSAARWLKLQLRELHVREAHIAAAVPMILSLALIPTEDEEAAVAFEQSAAFLGVTGRLPWYRRAIRWICGKKTVSVRRTPFVPVK